MAYRPPGFQQYTPSISPANGGYGPQPSMQNILSYGHQQQQQQQQSSVGDDEYK